MPGGPALFENGVSGRIIGCRIGRRYRGMANYNLGKLMLNKALVQEAAKFSQQSAQIESPYAEQARHNALVMTHEPSLCGNLLWCGPVACTATAKRRLCVTI